MKTRILLAILTIQIICAGFAEKSKKDLFLVKEWTSGSFYDETSCQTAWLFDDENKLYKVEPDTSLLRVYQSNLDTYDPVEADYTFLGADIYWSGFKSLFFYRSGKYYILKTNMEIGPIQLSEAKVADGHGLFGNLLIIEDLDEKLTGYLISNNASGLVKKMIEEELDIYITENISILEGLAMDEQGVPLFRGVPFTRSGFRKYWKANVGYFISIDKDLNTSYRDVIRDKHGNVIEKFGSDSEYLGRLTLDHEGNAFFFQGNQTYYIGRDWGFSNIREGRLNDSGVRVRLHPGTNELILSQVDKGIAVKVLEETPTKQTVGNKTAPWYKVKLPTGLVGWVFGAFVDIQK